MCIVGPGADQGNQRLPLGQAHQDPTWEVFAWIVVHSSRRPARPASGPRRQPPRSPLRPSRSRIRKLRGGCASSFPKSARHDLWRRDDAVEICVGSHRRQFQRSTFSPPAKSFRRCRPPTRSAQARSRHAHTVCYYFWGKDPTWALGVRGAVRAQRARHERLAPIMAAATTWSTSSLARRASSASRAETPASRWAAGTARRSTPSPTCRA